MISASQMIYASRMMGTDIIMSVANNKIPGYPLEIFDFVSGSGSYIMLAKQVYHTACRISYRVSDISLKTTTYCDIILTKEGVIMSDRFRVIKKYIDQMDYYDLLASGAPSDEFDIESKEISARIRDDHSVQDIAEIIALVFNKYFDEHDDATVFLAVAEQIEKELFK